ncbi:hypothetical protein PSCLAVI8L_130531 [Pseudoclavibacter sp. 8L]|nr:hypothetical protein PSCLAVI8L_130531 [Pseudoclavibacter sp. 8L]
MRVVPACAAEQLPLTVLRASSAAMSAVVFGPSGVTMAEGLRWEPHALALASPSLAPELDPPALPLP